MRNLDLGEEAIENSHVRRSLRTTTRRVHVAALLAAPALTVLALVVVKGVS